MIKRCLFSFIFFFLVCAPAIIASIPIVGLLLLTKWDGRSTIFGNAKWGRGNGHFSYPTKGFWQEFSWLVIRNPVNNLHTKYLAINGNPYVIRGNENIGDKIAGGFYEVLCLEAPHFWEYYWIKPYKVLGKSLCIRVRIGWKIHNNKEDKAAFVFTINPLKTYLGA